ncbi:MAG: hypothetical protein RRZ70_03125 [Synergistaceae bacterium]
MSIKDKTITRISFVFLCMLIGTALGIYLQSFPIVSRYFYNFVDWSFDVKKIDWILLSFSFFIKVNINLMTIIFGMFGIWMARK